MIKVVDTLLDDYNSKKVVENIKTNRKAANKERDAKNKELKDSEELKNINQKLKEDKKRLNDEKKLLKNENKLINKKMKKETDKENLLNMDLEVETLNTKIDKIDEDLIQCEIDALQARKLIEKKMKIEKD